jgi:K+-sensing histidine kinase KdpD
MRVLSDEVRWIVPHDVCFACFADRPHESYTVTIVSGGMGENPLEGKRIPAAEGIAGSVIGNQSPLSLDPCAGGDPLSADDPLLAALKAAGMHSLLIVPLRSGDETIGALGLGSAEPDAYKEQELVLAQLLATVVAIALQNASVFDDAKRRIAQIELVNELAQDLTSTLELDHLLSAAVDSIRKAFNYFDVSIFFSDMENGEASVVAHAGVYPDFLPVGYKQKSSEGIVGWAITHDERVLVDDVSKDPRYMAHVYDETKSELAIPIRVEHEIVGVLNIEDKRVSAFDETDTVVLGTLCDQLGSAIKNAQLYEQLKKTNEKLKELDRMKSDFLGIVSHDFRSPLASVVLAAKALLRRPDTVDQKRLAEYLQVIVDQANKLINLAEDTLSITRMEAGQQNYFFNMVNLERVVKDAMAGVNPSKRHQISYEIDPRVAYVRGDQTKLRQVLQNLLSNAVKYSPAGGKIDVRAANHSGEYMLVTITDQGMGIPQDQLSRLFQKFSRVDTPEAKEIKGSGLGLWICREIVKAHGGHIWVESTRSVGTTFSFTLKKAHPDTELE